MKTKTTIANTILSLLCFLYSTITYGQNSPENTVNIAGDAIINPTFEASLHEIVRNQEVLTRSLPSSVDNSSLMEGYMVTEQPEGYVVDANGDVHLHSAEALAWLCSVTNGLNGQEADDFNGKKVTLEANVDMSEAIGASLSGEKSAPAFRGTIDGNGHIIDGLQLTKSIGFKTGFFGNIIEATLSNIVIRRGYFEGYGFDIGFLASRATKSFIDRCFVECEMHGGGGMVPFIFTNI